MPTVAQWRWNSGTRHWANTARVDVDSTPSGLMAVRLGQPEFILGPGETRRVEFQMEQMTGRSGEDDEPVPVGLRISLPEAQVSDIVTSVYVTLQRPRRPDPRQGR